ncbi:hypothetical protein G6O69_32990 [Pseudenhygromyxa sp. WMMC2535]|uniref:hypothetical protein n=1 Tax=Pseudenhygromyxa sp. WMMC2535 TaxID=2712867 RepID=UPI0015573094|nr:hypothetical protein [Pseudenhygromyxa sp. WMMC2535]NVB42685.1 hypothetical protein [Pseudenhygromyxa sp. WMMC2535]
MDSVALVRDGLRISALLLAPIVAALVLLGQPDLAIAAVLGGMLGATNLIFLARGISSAIEGTVRGIDEARQARGEQPLAELEGAEAPPEDPTAVRRPIKVGGTFRLLLILLTIGALIVLRPGRPEGIVVGIVVVLLGVGISAHRHNRQR